MYKARYKIVENYNGVIDICNTIAFADSLQYAVLIVDSLNRSCDNPCYDYDFRKLDFRVDKSLDFYNGKVVNAKRLKDLEQ